MGLLGDDELGPDGLSHDALDIVVWGLFEEAKKPRWLPAVMDEEGVGYL